MDNHLAEKLEHLLCHKKSKVHAIFPSCAIYVDAKQILSFDFDLESDSSLLKSFSKEYKIDMRILIEFDAFRESEYLNHPDKFLIRFNCGEIQYGRGYSELISLLEHKKKKK